jgi:UDP-N-acetylglucosamine diphosphorylase/glucosamine-1-phosphate N-acetyltransferase
MNLILIDTNSRVNLLPLTFTRPTADCRIGILTIRQKWEQVLGCNTSSTITQDYLSVKYKLNIESDNWLINGQLLPNQDLVNAIKLLKIGEWLMANEQILAARLNKIDCEHFQLSKQVIGNKIEYKEPIKLVNALPQFFEWNNEQINWDFELVTKGRKSAPLSNTNRVTNAENIFLEPGAIVEHSILNAHQSKIYIGKDAEIMEGSMVRGSLALLDHSVLKLGSKIYGASTIGPHSKIGGEVNNSIIFGYTNKAHDGFMGNSVIGEWCNWGADSNNSNLKNNYEQVKLWSYEKQSFINTGNQFCGIIMADHSKCGINTMFNTGTVVGVSANIFGAGFPRNIIPDFTWGGPQGTTTYQLNKAIETAKHVYARRSMNFDEVEQEIFESIFNLTNSYRK